MRIAHYECPACLKVFRFAHHPNDEPPPNYCPLCGAYVGMDTPPVFVPQAPAIRTDVSRSVEAVHRGMEDSAAFRAEQAAEMLGVDVSETAGLKMTDMPDYLKPGETVAHGIKTNPVSEMMAKTPGLTGHQQNATAAGYAAMTTQGAGAYAGESTRQMVTTAHSQVASWKVGGGRLNKD